MRFGSRVCQGCSTTDGDNGQSTSSFAAGLTTQGSKYVYKPVVHVQLDLHNKLLKWFPTTVDLPGAQRESPQDGRERSQKRITGRARKARLTKVKRPGSIIDSGMDSETSQAGRSCVTSDSQAGGRRRGRSQLIARNGYLRRRCPGPDRRWRGADRQTSGRPRSPCSAGMRRAFPKTPSCFENRAGDRG